MTELTDLVPPNAGVDATTELGDATYNLGAWARAISAAVEAVEVLADAAQTSAEVSTAVDARLSSTNATDLTDGGNTTLHTHDALVPKSIGTTQGDTIYWTGSGTPARLAKGTAAQVLTMNSGATAPEWATAGGGGAMQVISRTVLGSDTASVDFTSIPSTYETLIVHYAARTTATGATWVDLKVRFNGDDATNYAWGRHWHQGGSGGLQNNASGATSIGIATILDADATANYAGTGVIQIPGYARTVFVKQITSTFTAQYANSNTQNEGNGAGLWASTAAINQITFLPASGNFKTGTVFTLYGLNGA